MFLIYDDFVDNILLPISFALLVPGIITFGYSVWINSKRRDHFRYPAPIVVILLLIVWAVVGIVSVNYAGFPGNYVASIHYIATREVSEKAFYYAQATIIACLAYKLIAAHFLSIRLSRTKLGMAAAFMLLLLVGAVFAYVVEISAQGVITRRSVTNRETLPYAISLAAYVMLVGAIAIIDVIAFTAGQIRF